MSKKCRVCPNRPRSWCPICKVRLCLEPCFKAYHQLMLMHPFCYYYNILNINSHFKSCFIHSLFKRTCYHLLSFSNKLRFLMTNLTYKWHNAFCSWKLLPHFYDKLDLPWGFFIFYWIWTKEPNFMGYFQCCICVTHFIFISTLLYPSYTKTPMSSNIIFW